MPRPALIVALIVPVAGFAVSRDTATADRGDAIEIRVPAQELQACRATLGALDEGPVVSDDGTFIPGFLVDDDLPRTVCVMDI